MSVDRTEQALRSLDALDEGSKLVEVWRVLEVLVVSMDGIGMYQHFQGEVAAKAALHAFMGPALNEKIADARYLISAVLEARYPEIADQLEKLAEDDKQMGYWDGPEG